LEAGVDSGVGGWCVVLQPSPGPRRSGAPDFSGKGGLSEKRDVGEGAKPGPSDGRRRPSVTSVPPWQGAGRLATAAIVVSGAQRSQLISLGES